MRTTKIYLVSNIDKDPYKVYVGKTVNDSREADHRRTYGDSIEFDFIDEVNSTDRKEWKPLECYWIEQFIQWGFKVVNKNSGGAGPDVHTQETRSLLSSIQKKVQKGIKRPWSYAAKLRNRGKEGKKHTEESKKLISKSNSKPRENTENLKKPKSDKWKEANRKPKTKFYNCSVCDKTISGAGNLKKHETSCRLKNLNKSYLFV
jgi:DNA-binding protein H-NS